MTTKTVTLPVETWEVILEALNEHQDSGPVGCGWQSDKLIDAHINLRESLTQNPTEQ